MTRKVSGWIILAAIILVPFAFNVAENGWIGAVVRTVLWVAVFFALYALAYFASHLIWGREKR